jgi:hypothetical protein
MPALIGALASIILPWCIDLSGIADPGIQAAATLLTAVIAIVTGALTGFIMKAAKKLEPDHGMPFADEPYWDVADDFPPLIV